MSSPIVVACGLFSSGSTWAYNAAIAIMLAKGRCEVGFAAELSEAVDLSAFSHAPVVIKTHGWGRPAAFLRAHPQARCILTIREPRDAVASLMQRFRYDFPTALDYVARSAAGVAAVRDGGGSLCLRYEDRFTDDPATIRSIARFLGADPDAATVQRIFGDLTPDAVRATIDRLDREGRFPDGMPAAEATDPWTQWHRGHIGDRRIGKHADCLGPGEQDAVVARLAAFMDRFGYPRG